jgi:hypothetical protein
MASTSSRAERLAGLPGEVLEERLGELLEEGAPQLGATMAM